MTKVAPAYYQVERPQSHRAGYAIRYKSCNADENMDTRTLSCWHSAVSVWIAREHTKEQ